MKEKQELHCHNCNRYVQFDIDMELNGNHVLDCPNCGHEHCRVVKDGVITGDRWDSRNGSYAATSTSTSATSTYTTYASATTSTNSIPTGATDTTTYLYDAWMRTT